MALDFMHAQSNLLKKVSGSHVSKEGNKPHAILMACSISDKDSYATITRFLLSEGLDAVIQRNLSRWHVELHTNFLR
jgi:hypothetical protein